MSPTSYQTAPPRGVKHNLAAQSSPANRAARPSSAPARPDPIDQRSELDVAVTGFDLFDFVAVAVLEVEDGVSSWFA